VASIINDSSSSVVATANSHEVVVGTIRHREGPLEQVVDILDAQHHLEIIQDPHPHQGHHLILLVTVPTLDLEVEAMAAVVAAAMATTGAAAAEVGVHMVEAVMAEVVEVEVTVAALRLHRGAMECRRQLHQLEAMADLLIAADLHMAVAVEHRRGHTHRRRATHLRPSIPEVLHMVVLQALGHDRTAVVVAVVIAVIDVEFSHFGTLLGCLWPQARCASEYARRVHFVVC